jgi:rfaE bifunctional protein nucleotidyltransferase chain/domain
MIVDYKKISEVINKLKLQNKKIVLCHGGFDFIHFGHLDHLKNAKKLGDVLIVSTTDDKYFDKGPDRPIYNNQKRSEFLDSLKFVDYVTIVPFKHAKEIILKVKPNIYCKGIEYKSNNHINHKIIEDRKAIKKVDGKIIYIGKNVMSSTKIFGKFSEKQNYSNIINLDLVINTLKKIKLKKIAVVGETIFDKYTFVDIKGLTSKNTSMSGNFIKSETYRGGAYKVYLNVKNFCKNTYFYTLSSNSKNKYTNTLTKDKNIKIFKDKNFIDIEKEKFVNNKTIDQKVSELEKYFGVAKINTNFFFKEQKEKELINKLKKELPSYDLVIVIDYGHGFINKNIAAIIQKYSKILSVNCQSNSMNYGFNAINDKFSKCDNFVLDLKEISLALKKKFKAEHDLKEVMKQLKSKTGFLTIGAKYSLGLEKKSVSYIPALNSEIIDSVGAGDSFFSINSLLTLTNLKIEQKNILSQIAGAYACGYKNNNYELTYNSYLNYCKVYLF